MNSKEEKCGHIRLVVDLDFFDRDVFARVVEKVVAATTQQTLTPQSQVGIRLDKGRIGRALLTKEEWAKRFATVRRILQIKEKRGITLEQTCAREGIPYSTFREWRRKMLADE